MSKKKNTKPIFGNSILKNLLAIIATGGFLIALALIFLHVYTRHGHNVVVPNLEGLQVEEANTILRSRGIHAEIVDSIYRPDAVPGAIIDQTPKANNNVKEGRAIYITIYSKSPQEVTVPGLVDYSTRQAVALLNSLGFDRLSIEEVPSQYSGLVLAVEYRGKRLAPDERIPAGSPLKLVVSSSALADSLNIDDDYILTPEANERSMDGGIDDSLF